MMTIMTIVTTPISTISTILSTAPTVLYKTHQALLLNHNVTKEEPTDPFTQESLFAPLLDISLSDAPPSLVVDGDSSTSSSDDAEDEADEDAFDDDDAFALSCFGQRNGMGSSVDMTSDTTTGPPQSWLVDVVRMMTMMMGLLILVPRL